MSPEQQRAALPPEDLALPANEPKQSAAAMIGREAWFVFKVISGGIGAIWASFQILGIGLVTQQQYAKDRTSDAEWRADTCSRISVVETRVTDHMSTSSAALPFQRSSAISDTPSRTAANYTRIP